MESRVDPGGVVLVLVTWPAKRDVSVLTRALVERRLAACVNVLPEMRSVYTWEGAVHDDPEHQVIIKTARARLKEVEALVAQTHPYDLPEFLVLSAETGSAAYLAWVNDSTAPLASD
jgi:periplasmic divalent cation tolerance protein